MTASSLVVSEIFGPTWQGEGPSLGRLAAFVRLGRCNLACTWCDTPYTWDWSRFDPVRELHRRPVDDVAAEVERIGTPLVVVTGGEPLLQQGALVELLRTLSEHGPDIEIETAGTIAPAAELVPLVQRFNVSPKLASSGNPRERRYRPDVLRGFAATGKAAFKFVATGPGDLDEIGVMTDECGLAPVYVMPEGTDPETLNARLRELADPVLARGWNLTTRLHVMIWGDRRGV